MTSVFLLKSDPKVEESFASGLYVKVKGVFMNDHLLD